MNLKVKIENVTLVARKKEEYTNKDGKTAFRCTIGLVQGDAGNSEVSSVTIPEEIYNSLDSAYDFQKVRVNAEYVESAFGGNLSRYIRVTSVGLESPEKKGK